MERESNFGTHEGPTFENRVLSTKTFTQPLSLFILFIISFILSLGHERFFQIITRVKKEALVLLFYYFYYFIEQPRGSLEITRFFLVLFSLLFSITQKKRHNKIYHPLQSLVQISTARADAHNTIIAP